MAGGTPDAVADQDEVKFASFVKVSRKRFGEYGTPGVLALTAADKLIFMTSKPSKRWEIARSSVASVKRPWWGMGSLVTFSASGAYYALAFSRGGPVALTSASDVTIRFGGAIGTQAGIVADALAVAQMRATAKVGRQWFELLSART